MLPETDCRFDGKLAEWFSRRGGAWSGTAGELLASLRTSADVGNSLRFQSSSELYAHLQSHRQILHSLGVDVLLLYGVPRIVSLRSCRDNHPQKKPPYNAMSIEHNSHSTVNLSPLVTGTKSYSADSIDTSRARNEAFKPIAKSDMTGKSVTDEYTDGNGPIGGFFVNTGEALFAIVEMRRQIREQCLDLESAVDLVIGRAQQITRSYGIAVGFLPQETGNWFRPGVAPSDREMNFFHANLFRSRLVEGEAVQVPDAQKHPLLGATCGRAGIGSLIVVPIFRNREVAGAIEFFFREKRSFSPGDVMDLGLIAGVISESWGSPKRMVPPETKIVVNVEEPESLPKQEADPGKSLLDVTANTTDSDALTESAPPVSVVSGSVASKLATSPAQFWLNFKRVWTRHPRGM